MNPALQPFLTVALPIMVTMVASELWFIHADRHSDMNRRFDEVNGRLDRIERKLKERTHR